MRKIFGVLAGLFIILMIAVLLAPFFVPVEQFKPVIARQVEAATGRVLNINGQIHLSILPRLSLVAEDVSLSNPLNQGYKNPEMMHINALDIDIALLPLLRGEVDVKRFVLQDPSLDLEKTASGQNNWTFSPKEPAPEAAPATGHNAGVQAAASPLHLMAGLTLAGVAIHNGKVVYSRPGAPDQTIKNLEADIRLSALDKPLDTTVSAIVDGQPVRVAVHLETPGSLLGNHAAGVDISAATPSMGSFTTRMHVAITADTFSTNVNAFDVKTPAVTASGTGSLQLHVTPGQRADIQANLSFSKVTYAPSGDPATPATTQGKPAPKAAHAPAGLIDLSPLGAINGNLTLHADKIVLPQATFAPFDGTITLNNRNMDVTLKKLGIYGGDVGGSLHLSGRTALPEASANLHLAALDAGQALAALKMPLKAHGLLSGKASFATTGNTVADMVSDVSGNMDILLDKAGVEDVDLPALMKQSFGPVGAALSPKISPKANTLLAANAQSLHLVGTAKNGVLTLSKIDMAGPVMTGTGGGAISLPRQALDLKVNATLNPQMVDARDAVWKDGIPLPFTIKGTFSAPVYGPDAAVLSKFAAKEAADRAVHYASKKLGVDLGGVLGALTGDKTKDATPAKGNTEQPAIDPGKLLNNLFGK